MPLALDPVSFSDLSKLLLSLGVLVFSLGAAVILRYGLRR